MQKNLLQWCPKSFCQFKNKQLGLWGWREELFILRSVVFEPRRRHVKVEMLILSLWLWQRVPTKTTLSPTFDRGWGWRQMNNAWAPAPPQRLPFIIPLTLSSLTEIHYRTRSDDWWESARSERKPKATDCIFAKRDSLGTFLLNEWRGRGQRKCTPTLRISREQVETGPKWCRLLPQRLFASSDSLESFSPVIHNCDEICIS